MHNGGLQSQIEPAGKTIGPGLATEIKVSLSYIVVGNCPEFLDSEWEAPLFVGWTD